MATWLHITIMTISVIASITVMILRSGRKFIASLTTEKLLLTVFFFIPTSAAAPPAAAVAAAAAAAAAASRILKGGWFKRGRSQGSLGSFREPKGAPGRIGDYWVIYPS